MSRGVFMEHSIIDELGNVTYTDEKPRDPFARQCARALAEFQSDGSLPTEELKAYFEKERQKQE
jgi:hypothetical protein